MVGWSRKLEKTLTNVIQICTFPAFNHEMVQLPKLGFLEFVTFFFAPFCLFWKYLYVYRNICPRCTIDSSVLLQFLNGSLGPGVGSLGKATYGRDKPLINIIFGNTWIRGRGVAVLSLFGQHRRDYARTLIIFTGRNSWQVYECFAHGSHGHTGNKNVCTKIRPFSAPTNIRQLS